MKTNFCSLLCFAVCCALPLSDATIPALIVLGFSGSMPSLLLRALCLVAVQAPALLLAVASLLLVLCCAWRLCHFLFSRPLPAQGRLPLRLRGGYDFLAAIESDFRDFDLDLSGNEDEGHDDAGDAGNQVDDVSVGPGVEDLFFGLFAPAVGDGALPLGDNAQDDGVEFVSASPRAAALPLGENAQNDGVELVSASLRAGVSSAPDVGDLFFGLFAPAPTADGVAVPAAAPDGGAERVVAAEDVASPPATANGGVAPVVAAEDVSSLPSPSIGGIVPAVPAEDSVFPPAASVGGDLFASAALASGIVPAATVDGDDSVVLALPAGDDNSAAAASLPPVVGAGGVLPPPEDDAGDVAVPPPSVFVPPVLPPPVAAEVEAEVPCSGEEEEDEQEEQEKEQQEEQQEEEEAWEAVPMDIDDPMEVDDDNEDGRIHVDPEGVWDPMDIQEDATMTLRRGGWRRHNAVLRHGRRRRYMALPLGVPAHRFAGPYTIPRYKGSSSNGGRRRNTQTGALAAAAF